MDDFDEYFEGVRVGDRDFVVLLDGVRDFVLDRDLDEVRVRVRVRVGVLL